MNTYEILEQDQGMLLRIFHFINIRFKANKTGGFITIDRGVNERIFPGLGVLPVGSVPDTKMQKYCVFSQEKVHRLRANPKTNTSYETRDPDENKWGGAVRLPDGTLIGFSGLPELGDECLVLMYAYHKKLITEIQALELSNDKKRLSDFFDAFDFSD